MKTATRPKLIVALDVDSYDRAAGLVDALAPLGVWFKIGYEPLFGFGDRIRAKLEAANANVFVDGKLHDIPRTVEAAIQALVRPGVRILTVHAIGGNDMLVAAVAAAESRAPRRRDRGHRRSGGRRRDSPRPIRSRYAASQPASGRPPPSPTAGCPA